MPPSNFHPAMEVYRHAFGGAVPAGAAGGVQKTPSPRRAPRFCPGRPPAEDEGVQTPPGQRPRAAEFCFRGTTSLAALLQAATLPRPCPQRAWMRCPVTGAKRRCATGAVRPVPAGCSQGMFLFRPASAFSAPGGSLCAGSWEKNVSCSKQFGLLHRSDVGSTLVPPRPFVNYFLSVSSHFLQKTCANCKILCSLNFSLRKKQKQGVLAHAIAPPTPPRPVPFRRARAKRRPSAAILRF